MPFDKWTRLPEYLKPDVTYKRREGDLRMPSAIVVLSGGQDSATCLAWAVDKFVRVEAITFDYGQRHAQEIKAAEKIAKEVGVSWKLVTVGGLTGSALTDHEMEVSATGGMDNLPTTFTPGRNAVFLATACGYAVTRDIEHVVTGICETDYSGYPDCREDFRASMETTMSLALGREMFIHAPLMFIDKAETVRMADTLGALNLVGMSLTCYQPAVHYMTDEPLACGECPACVIRARGFKEADVVDPTPYVA